MYRNAIPELPSTLSRNSKEKNNRLKQLILDFYNSTDDYSELFFDHGEYASSVSLYTGAKKAIESLQIPVEVIMIRGGVYLRRTD